MGIDLGELPAFAVGCLVIALAPGVDAFLLLRTSIRSGTRSGLLVLGGIYTASVIQVSVVISGVGMFVVQHPALLAALRWGGAGYLLYLGASLLRALWLTRRVGYGQPGAGTEPTMDPHPYLRGLLSDITNPKMLLFCLAFLPQFVGKASSPLLQLVVLGCTFLVVTASWEGTLVFLASRIANRLRQPRTMRALDMASAAVFLGLSVSMIAS